MKHSLRCPQFFGALTVSTRFLSAFLLLWAASLSSGRAQTLDPAFHIPGVYGEARLVDAAQMPNGQLVVAGGFTRANGQASKNLARFDAAGVEDPTFRQNLSGAAMSIKKLVPMANGQLLVQGSYLAGSVRRDLLFRLNADGSFDPTLNLVLPGVGTLPNLQQALVQPDGRILLLGWYLSSNSFNKPEVLRVLSNGTLDASFNPALIATSGPSSMVLQPDGKIILAGFPALNLGNAPIVRLNSNGSADPSFQSDIRLVGQERIDCVALDATGALVVGGIFSVPPAAPSASLRRLLSTGAADPSFTAPASLVGRYCTQVEALPNGQVLVLAATYSANSITYPFNEQLIKLQANGAIDASFQQGNGPDNYLWGIRALPNGNFLTWGNMNNYAGQRRTVALVQPNGGLDASFAPLLQEPAEVDKVVRQADGKLLVSGRFNSIDGHLTDRLARLLPDGQPDPAFAWRQPTSAGWRTTALAAQADGRVLVAGLGPNTFSRLTASGAPDPSFAPALVPAAAGARSITLISQLANGQLIVGGSFTDAAGKANLTRLNADGSVEPTFAPSSTQLPVNAGFVQADGSIVCLVPVSPVVNAYKVGVVRLLPTGAPDPTFNYVSITDTYPDDYGATAIDQIPTTGGYATGGMFTSTRLVAACTATGADVAGFASPFRPLVTPTVLESGINALAVQSDGRILVGGRMQQSSNFNTPVNMLARLNANGQLDATFNASVLAVPAATLATGYPPQSGVSTIVVQPDGAIVAGGYFLLAAGQPVTGLVRFLPAGVLAVRAAQATQTEVWPVPAQAALNLKLDAAARPQRVTLVDALGKIVLTQPATQAELTLNTAALARGLYVLRVDYASGPATRRVVLE